jgi:hypothetical protein
MDASLVALLALLVAIAAYITPLIRGSMAARRTLKEKQAIQTELRRRESDEMRKFIESGTAWFDGMPEYIASNWGAGKSLENYGISDPAMRGRTSNEGLKDIDRAMADGVIFYQRLHDTRGQVGDSVEECQREFTNIESRFLRAVAEWSERNEVQS